MRVPGTAAGGLCQRPARRSGPPVEPGRHAVATPKADVPVRVQAEDQYLEGYVHACRLPPAQAAEARRRARVKAKKKGRSVQRRTLLLAEWVFVIPGGFMLSIAAAAVALLAAALAWIASSAGPDGDAEGATE